MKLFKYLEYINESNEDIDSICKKWGIKNYTIKDGLVHVDGDVRLTNRRLTEFPLKFGEVSGNFKCDLNLLTTLEGVPSRVEGYFDCSFNKLTALEGAPSRVGGYFDCSYNRLTNLEGAPSRVGGNFYCYYN